MKKYVFLVLTFISSLTFAQNNNLTSIYAWTAGAGVNIVDNDGRQFKNVFKTKHWNFGNPISLNIENKFSDVFAANFAITLNKLTPKNEQNFQDIDKDRTLFAVDATVKFIYDGYFLPDERFDPFEAYIVSGFGYTTIGINSSMFFDIGFGFNFWFFPEFGLRLQTLGKFAFTDQTYLNNYLQHTAEVIYRF